MGADIKVICFVCVRARARLCTTVSRAGNFRPKRTLGEGLYTLLVGIFLRACVLSALTTVRILFFCFRGAADASLSETKKNRPPRCNLSGVCARRARVRTVDGRQFFRELMCVLYAGDESVGVGNESSFRFWTHASGKHKIGNFCEPILMRSVWIKNI